MYPTSFSPTGIKAVLKSISDFAEASNKFQEVQDQNSGLLQRGDQKIGVIGEFYGLLYAISKHPEAKVTLSENPSDDIKDILVAQDNSSLHIQVKTVSAFSETRKTTPVYFEKLTQGSCHLYLLSLDRNLHPDGFWIIENIPGSYVNILSKRIVIPKGTRTGSIGLVNWEEDNKITELHSVISAYL